MVDTPELIKKQVRAAFPRSDRDQPPPRHFEAPLGRTGAQGSDGGDASEMAAEATTAGALKFGPSEGGPRGGPSESKIAINEDSADQTPATNSPRQAGGKGVGWQRLNVG